MDTFNKTFNELRNKYIHEDTSKQYLISFNGTSENNPKIISRINVKIPAINKDHALSLLKKSKYRVHNIIGIKEI